MSSLVKLATQVSLLKRGKALNQLSLWMTFFGVLLMVMGNYLSLDNGQLIGWFIIVITGLIQQYYALRVSLDADLFSCVAASIQRCVDSEQPNSLELSLQALDSQLTTLGLKKPSQTGQTLDARFEGAMRLLKGQLFCTLIQAILLVTLLACIGWASL